MSRILPANFIPYRSTCRDKWITEVSHIETIWWKEFPAGFIIALWISYLDLKVRAISNEQLMNLEKNQKQNEANKQQDLRACA